MDIHFVRASWTWAMSLIALSIAIRATGVVMMALVVLPVRPWLEHRDLSPRCVVPVVIGVVAAVGLLLLWYTDRDRDLGGRYRAPDTEGAGTIAARVAGRSPADPPRPPEPRSR
jgi:hypothetical protein